MVYSVASWMALYSEQPWRKEISDFPWWGLLPEKALEPAEVTLFCEGLSSSVGSPRWGFSGWLRVWLQILEAGEACWSKGVKSRLRAAAGMWGHERQKVPTEGQVLSSWLRDE